MNNHRINAIIVGIFYILAAVTSIIAVVFYQPILSDEWYTVVENGLETKILVGVINELAVVATVIGTTVMLFPYLRGWNEHASLGYLCFRFMEAVLITIGIVSILVLLHLSGQYAAGSVDDFSNLTPIGLLLQSVYRWTSLLGPNIMLGLNTVLYSYLLFRTKLVPKKLASFGMLTAIMVFIAGILDMFGVIGTYSTAKALIALPVGVYEISLAVWLIIKGFNLGNMYIEK